jgi:hypothetical protein
MTKLLWPVIGSALLLAGPRRARAQEVQEIRETTELDAQQQFPPEYAPPIPPNAEGQAQAAPNGYCYAGPHPVDTRVEGGGPWDETEGQHLHAYPPFDLRLFALRDGCYYFVGDPTDFGYTGSVYSYYGAHPVLDRYGGGWCFVIGAHNHMWEPWSSYFTVVGPWNYWAGPYDAYFWSYWPYYSHYYQRYYPRYYGGGRWLGDGRNVRVAPPITRVPRPSTPVMGWRGGNVAPPAHAPGGNVAPPSSGGGVAGPYWRATPPASRTLGSGTVAPRTVVPARPVAPQSGWVAPIGGGSTMGNWGGGFSGSPGSARVAPAHVAPSMPASPSMPIGRPAMPSAPSYRAAPSSGGGVMGGSAHFGGGGHRH